MNPIYILLAVLIGFYLGRQTKTEQGIGQQISNKVKGVKQVIKKKYGEPFVVSTDEAELEQSQRQEKRDIIDLKDFPK